MTTKRTEVLLGSGNYFHWEYNMRMTLARKGLLGHIMTVNPESEITEAWLINNAKAQGIPGRTCSNTRTWTLASR
ncbi:hypothetical protein PC129_g1721 [Phytophthora cactorum]|nr:hypothetical protein Pcac1_g2591 [Phytophthora cactorum]KAG2840595.1 hypothetical protein PC112_g3698 [Phytophthora cactorum]KAG2842258.1 hypothetical protein PC111_g2771 [Phytophthora cactorum]KAG2869194.1 hypothetical protein PC113_g413 [Phytophthora cactorum]KAG2924737.1 hypothetical protein PC114_g4362 [Phytophthora cactorum]